MKGNARQSTEAAAPKTSAGAASAQTPQPAATLLSARGPLEADPQESLEAHCFEVGVRVRLG